MTRSIVSLLCGVGAALLALPATAQHEHIYIYSSAAAGGALLADYDFAPAVHVAPRLPFCPGGSCPYSSNSPAFDSADADQPGLSRFALVAGTMVRFEVVSIAAGASMKLGATILDAAGEAVDLGTADFHTHPEWQVVAPEGVEGDWQVAFRLTTTAPGYAPSGTYTLTFTNREVGTPTPTPPPPIDTPTATPTATPAVASPCAATPIACETSARSVFKVRASPAAPDRSALLFKWLRGTIAAPGDLGDPTTETDYALCVYDDGALVNAYAIAAAGTCAGRPCWTSTPAGVRFGDDAGNAAGIRALSIRHGAGSARIVVRGGGVRLALPSSAPPYDQASAVTVQVVNGLGRCWGTVLAPPAVRRDAARFIDRTP